MRGWQVRGPLVEGPDLPGFGRLPGHSTRSARIGSIVAARRAGIQVASSATVTAIQATTAASPTMPDGGSSP